MSGCTLRFARNSPLRTTLIDAATGHARYQIDTPIRITRSVTRIRKLESSARPSSHWDDDAGFDSGDDITNKGKKKKPPSDDITNVGKKKKEKKKKPEKDEGDGKELPQTSDEIARIYWKWFSSDRIIFRGKARLRTEFLPKCGKMKGSYMFTGPDGVQYRWALGACGMNFPRLVTADEKKTVIAQFHRPRYFRKKRKARLEIQPAGMDMLDYIILTFVFAENKRREREARAKSAGG